MSFKGKDDMDRKNKLLLFNLFWNIGFTPRIEIPIFEFMGDKKFGTEITDLDILGWKYIPFIGVIKVTGSAKGNIKNVSHKSEIFKLKGVNSYFSPIQSFYIHESSPTDELYWFAKNMGIEILSKHSIISMSNRIENFFTLTNKGANILSDAILRAKEINKYDFLTSLIWISKTPDKIYKLEGLLADSIKDFNDFEDQINMIYILYLISTYIVTLIQILEMVHNTSSSDFPFKLKLALYGGKDIYRNVVDLIDGFNEYITKQYNESKKTFEYESYIPRFEKHSELIRHFFINIEVVYTIIRVIDYLIFNYAENGVILDINDIISNFSDSEEKKKKSLGLLRHLFTYLKNYINPEYQNVAIKLNIFR